MQTNLWKANAQLLLAAGLWGFAFVAQRIGMQHVGPFSFNGVRFALGTLSLLPLIRYQPKPIHSSRRQLMSGGLLAGSMLFLGSSFQQVGIVYTTAGKAGFITGLYVVLVPILDLVGRAAPVQALVRLVIRALTRSSVPTFHVQGSPVSYSTWAGALLAATGLYLLSITGRFTMARGDALVFVGAFFWAGHVHLIGWFSGRVDPIRLAAIQFAICSLLSLLAALVTESIQIGSLYEAALPILYGGVISVGIAYTLQVVAQRHAQPTHAAIILSLEAAFAALGGWVVLGETLSSRSLVGCALMLAGMLLSQKS